MKILKNILPLSIFLFSLYSCAQNDPSKTISASDLKERINNNDTTMVILDVRTDEEIKTPLLIIDGALHIPVQEIGERYNELELYKDKEIIIVCRTQNRSSKAAGFLNEKGYNAKYVIGGMTEYHTK